MDSPRINRALARLASEDRRRKSRRRRFVSGGNHAAAVCRSRNGWPTRSPDLEGDRPPVGMLDITLYRDDLSTVGAKPIVNRTDLPGDIENRNIVLIDDVLYTGRTIRAALDQLIDFGRPKRVQLAVLIDRGKEHRELPIQADYIGKLVPTKKSEIIKVMLQEFDEEEGVVIVERPPGGSWYKQQRPAMAAFLSVGLWLSVFGLGGHFETNMTIKDQRPKSKAYQNQRAIFMSTVQFSRKHLPGHPRT
mgnify:CR=1 FL=1